MVAADVEETSEAAEGTVVEVYRTGYVWNGEVFQPAQVKVARSPQAGCVQREKD
jgi:molecular chaperone GrpE (heat shock protein)